MNNKEAVLIEIGQKVIKKKDNHLCTVVDIYKTSDKHIFFKLDDGSVLYHTYVFTYPNRLTYRRTVKVVKTVFEKD